MLRPTLICLIAATPLAAQDATEGQRLYETWCALCHGTEASGGTVAGTAIPGLTGLKAANGGTFPVEAVAAQIDGRARSPSHSFDMPMFGAAFDGPQAAMPTETGQPVLMNQPIADLISYLETLQN